MLGGSVLQGGAAAALGSEPSLAPQPGSPPASLLPWLPVGASLLGGEPRPVKHLLSFPGGPEDRWGRAHADPDPGGRRRVSQ